MCREKEETMIEELCCQDVMRGVILSSTEAVMKWLIFYDYPGSTLMIILLGGRNTVFPSLLIHREQRDAPCPMELTRQERADDCHW